MAVKTNKVWSLEKYARFVPDVHLAAKEGSKTGGQWQVSCKLLLQIHLYLLLLFFKQALPLERY